jgi:hypothetical protein
MDDKFRSRKFMVAVYFSLMDSLLTGVIIILDQSSALGAFGAFIGAQATILALYGGANVLEKRQ